MWQKIGSTTLALDRSQNILRRQNPLELVFEDILTFDAENPIVGSLLKDVGKNVRCWNARC